MFPSISAIAEKAEDARRSAEHHELNKRVKKIVL